MEKNNDFRADIEAIRDAKEASFVEGDIYSDHRGTEYQIIKVIEQRGINRAELLRMKDGAVVSGTVAALNPTTGRKPTAADRKTIAKWQEKVARVTQKLVPGMVVKLTEKKDQTAANKSFPGKGAGNFVVVKVNDKTSNIVPLGGDGVGLAYLRVTPGLVTIVNL